MMKDWKKIYNKWKWVTIDSQSLARTKCRSKSFREVFVDYQEGGQGSAAKDDTYQRRVTILNNEYSYHLWCSINQKPKQI